MTDEHTKRMFVAARTPEPLGRISAVGETEETLGGP
jgi:hypothetical protein